MILLKIKFDQKDHVTVLSEIDQGGSEEPGTSKGRNRRNGTEHSNSYKYSIVYKYDIFSFKVFIHYNILSYVKIQFYDSILLMYVNSLFMF